MLVKLQPQNEKVREMYQNHGHFHQGDSGLDLFFPEDTTIKAGETVLIDLQIKLETGESYWLMPRSSIIKTPLRMANSMGLIDKAYRGNIKACVDNIKKEDHTIKKGERLFQIVSADLKEINLEIVNFVGITSRGEGGFGSTGL